MAALPLELQIKVVEWVYRASQDTEIHYATLRACALVCRAWTTTAQRLLLRRLPFPIHFSTDTHHRAVLLLRTLRERPLLAAHIISVKFDLANLDAVDLDDPCSTLLKLCPRIACIRASCSFDTPRNYDLHVQRRSLGMRLRSLALQPVVLRVAGNKESVNYLINIWPTVRVLDVSTWRRQRRDGPSICNLPFVEALSFSDISAFDLKSPEASFSALREMELKPGWSTDFRRVFGSGVFAGIHSLRIHGPCPPPEIFRHLVHLTRLAFTELPQGDPSLPQTIRHVGYHVNRLIMRLEHTKDIKPFAAALCALPDLQHVNATPFLSPLHMATLEEVCRGRGIDLEICGELHSLWRPINIDWI
ncbi:hypothetical protein FA95DRAFT_982226 [Auriscalpium vulgare]|uniref:Uncharacterized protein n=1 Tax=Auriscalpium vulgare TaxID=40419 RepID=A0ACB8R8B4_9AGAM|nr:hypothetical protein FA95DRAFT_982226 [Auriscalpium vulgare]